MIEKFYKDKKVLVTGGYGYLGSVLVKRLEKLGAIVTKPKFLFTVEDNWKGLLDDKDVIFHLASREYNKDEPTRIDLHNNVLPMIYLLEECRAKDIQPTIVFTSSTNVFGVNKGMISNEWERPIPLSTWSAHKLLCEEYLHINYVKTGQPAISLRLPNVYGPSTTIDLSNRMVLNRVISTKDKMLKLYNNHECVRDFVYINDVIELLLVAPTESDDYLNGESVLLSSNKNRYIEQTWEIIAGITQKPIEYDYETQLEPTEYRSFHTQSQWKCKTLLEDGILWTLDFYEGK